MRQKELKLVITFHTTEEAIALENLCKRESIPGRLIPVPRILSSGCGLSWSMPAEWKEQMGQILRNWGLQYQAMGEYVI